MQNKEYVLSIDGHCPICASNRKFNSETGWFRDWLKCSGCGSIPRERALAVVLDDVWLDWRNMAVHESSPTPRGISSKLRKSCKQYTETQFYPGEPLGQIVRNYRNQNLENLTFADGAFDIFVA